MNVLYISTVCSDAKFKEIYNNSEVKPQQQAQKFHNLLSKGLLNSVKSIDFLSRPPINNSTKKTVGISGKEVIDKATYHYLRVSKIPIIRHLVIFFSCLFYTIKWRLKNKKEDKFIICDILNLSISISALLYSKISGIKTMAIITDLPNYMNYSKEKKSIIRNISSKLYRTLCNFFLKKYNCYLLLTEQMNKLVNPKNKPYIVIEGLVDKDMELIPNEISKKYKERVIMYTGALYEKYGIKSLIEAFIKLEDNDIRLWLYGNGDMVQLIKHYESLDNRIKYFGVVPNDIVVQEQLKATLLVNPRPSVDEFTKYSFPSKNMEYMVSGTPILTTPLQGMPKEYYDYVYIFEDESIIGMSNTIAKILSKSKEELHAKGLKAKEFVIKEKNNFVQARRLFEFLEKYERVFTLNK